MIVGISYPDGGLWPLWLWQLIADLGVLAAVAGIIAGVIYLWNHGPRLLIEHGPQWMTTLGVWLNKVLKRKAEPRNDG